ncbi:MAG: tetratricopeptide repeat protein [Planctomycetota bacterium]
MRTSIAKFLIRYADATRAARAEPHAGQRALRWAEKLASDEPSVVIALAERDRDRGNLQEAEERLARSLAAHHEHPRLTVALASIYTRTGRASDALRMLENLLASDSVNNTNTNTKTNTSNARDAIDARLELSIVLGACGRLADAALQAEIVLQQLPNDPELRGYYGYLQHKLGNAEAAEREFKQAFLVGSPSDRVFGWHAKYYVDRGDRKNAVEILRKGIEKYPRSTRLLGDYARFLAEQGAAKEAEELLRKALEIDPADPLTLATIGSLLTRGNATEGETYFRYALAIDPGHEASILGILKVYDRDQRHDDAVRIVEKAAAHPAASGRVLCICAGRLAEANRYDSARSALALAAQRAPSDSTVALAYADVLLHFNELKEAERWYLEALRNCNGDPRVLARVASWHLEYGRVPEAESLANQALEKDARCVEALGIKSGLLAYRNRYEEALATRRETIQLDPDNAASHLDAADLLARLERYEDALVEIQIASRLNPTGRLLIDYSIVLLNQKRAPFGIVVLDDLVKTGRGGARMRFVYSHLLAALGKADEARLHLAAALEGGIKEELDTPRLKEARNRVVASVDPSFCKTIGL